MSDLPNVTGVDAENVKNTSDTSGVLATKVKTIEDFMHVVVIFLIVSFVSLLITVLLSLGAMYQDYLSSKQATYQQLLDKVNIIVEQNNNKFSDEKNLRINELEQQIKDIKKVNYLK